MSKDKQITLENAIEMKKLHERTIVSYTEMLKIQKENLVICKYYIDNYEVQSDRQET